MHALLLALLLLAWAPMARAGTVRVGIFVGNDIGFGEDEPLAHAEREARDMAEVFQEMGDLERERTVLLTGRKAPEVRQALFGAEAQIREMSARGDDVQVVFYYSGHASREGLHLQGSLLPMAAVRRWLEASSARVRVAFIDACESGTLARTRGGSPIDVIDVAVDDALTSRGLAVITSTGPLSVARESDALGGAVFSRALLTGLRGSADLDADGRITLDEAYRHAFEGTVATSFAGSAGVQRPEYRFELSGVGDVVLTRIPSRAAGLLLPEELEGTYTVVSVGSGQVVARVEKNPGEARRLALPPGRYLVRKVRREDVLLSEVDLVWGGDRMVDDRQMTSVELGDPLARGGWTDRPVRVSLRGTGGTRWILGNPGSVGGEAAVRWRLAPRLRLDTIGGFARGEREEWEGVVKLSSIRVGAGLAGEWNRERMDLSVGAGIQGIAVQQAIEVLLYDDEEEPISEANLEAWQRIPGGYAQAGMHVPVGPWAGIEAGARANLYRGLIDDQGRFLIEGQGFLGLTFGLGGRTVGRARRR